MIDHSSQQGVDIGLEGIEVPCLPVKYIRITWGHGAPFLGVVHQNQARTCGDFVSMGPALAATMVGP